MLSSSLRFLIYGLLLAELLLFTWYRKLFGPQLSAAVLYGLAVLLCVVLYFYHRHRQWLPLVPEPSAVAPAAHWPRLAALATGAVAGGLVTTERLLDIVERFSINISYSDIIPALQVYTRRWLLDTDIYVPLTWELGYFALPTYLPATWFPFLAAEYWHFDYRIMAWTLLLLLGAGGYLLVLWRLRQAWLPTLLLALVPFFYLYAFERTEESLFGFTVESLIYGYYGLLAAGILLRSWPLQAVALVACLLSRYSLVFWVPLLLGLVFFQDSRRRGLLLAGTVLAGVLLLYVVPYMSQNWGLFMEVQRSYTDVAVFEWEHLSAEGQPLHLYNGVGLAPYFYEHVSGSLRERVVALKTVHFALLVLIVGGAALLYWRQRGPRTDYRVYALLVLKLYLATFYAFLQVPYAYLAATGVFMSAFLVLLTVGARQQEPVFQSLDVRT